MNTNIFYLCTLPSVLSWIFLFHFFFKGEKRKLFLFLYCMFRMVKYRRAIRINFGFTSTYNFINGKKKKKLLLFLPWRYRWPWPPSSFFTTLLDLLQQLFAARYQVVSARVVAFLYFLLQVVHTAPSWRSQYQSLCILWLAPDYTWLSRLLSHIMVCISCTGSSSPRLPAFFLCSAVIVHVSQP